MRRYGSNWMREGGHKFTSDTETEVLAHLIGSIYEQIDGADSKSAPGQRRLAPPSSK